jgi:ABC-type bacteriocin/lantibiotic exporter with double-glycine peptidase domain
VHAIRGLLIVPFVGLGACSYLGHARDFDPAALKRDAGWLSVPDVPLILQKDEKDCGAAALAMVLTYWGAATAPEEIGAAVPVEPDRGIKAKDLRSFAEGKGLKAFVIRGEVSDLEKELGKRRPVIVGLVKPFVDGARTHYEVVVGLHVEGGRVVTLDPAKGWRENSRAGFFEEWEPAGRLTMVAFRPEERAERCREGGD